MKLDTLESLRAFFAQYPELLAGPASSAEIQSASAALGMPFPDDYREFLSECGGGIVGPCSIYGVRPVDAMGRDWSVVAMTEAYRSQRWPGVEEWLIVSSDHGGNPIGVGRDGQVWISDHDLGVVEVLAVDFEEFLRTRCLGR